ncbi:MAG: DUF2066 domain-containing protein [Parvularcula sp.]
MMSRALTLFFLIFAACGVANAQTREIFTVPKVPVYAEAETASAAQAAAQAQGRRRAMDILLRRLTAEEDWDYLPRLAAGEPAAAPATVPVMPDEMFDNVQGLAPVVTKSPVSLVGDQLVSMEEGFAIFDEKTSPTSYRARITYRFKPEGVRRLLQDAGLPYSEAQSRRALIVPVLETDDNVYLWETRNPWARAWLDRPLENELTPMILPIGDRQDVDSITGAAANELDVEGLGRLAARYRTGQVFVAQGKLQHVDGEYRLLVRLIDGYFADRADTNATAEAARYDSEDGFGAEAVQPATSRRGRVVAEAFFRGPDDDFPALAQRAVETIVARYAKGWKSKTLVDHSSIRSLRVTAWFSGLGEWGTIQRALEGTPLVRGLKVGAMNKENAVIDLRLIGDNNQLILAMRQSGLTVWQAADGTWNIADNGRARNLQLELNDVALSRREMDRFNIPDPDRVGQPLGMDPAIDFGPAENDDPMGVHTTDGPAQLGAPVQLDAPVALEMPAPTDDDDAVPAEDAQ